MAAAAGRRRPTSKCSKEVAEYGEAIKNSTQNDAVNFTQFICGLGGTYAGSGCESPASGRHAPLPCALAAAHPSCHARLPRCRRPCLRPAKSPTAVCRLCLPAGSRQRHPGLQAKGGPGGGADICRHPRVRPSLRPAAAVHQQVSVGLPRSLRCITQANPVPHRQLPRCAPVEQLHPAHRRHPRGCQACLPCRVAPLPFAQPHRRLPLPLRLHHRPGLHLP